MDLSWVSFKIFIGLLMNGGSLSILFVRSLGIAAGTLLPIWLGLAYM
jgi:hypothetical protein